MSVPVFIGDFVELPQPGEMLTITGAEAKHISVRRLKPGGTIVLTDGADARVEVELLAVNPQQVQAQVRTAIRSPRPGQPVTVVQALPKSERAELAVGPDGGVGCRCHRSLGGDELCGSVEWHCQAGKVPCKVAGSCSGSGETGPPFVGASGIGATQQR